MVDNGSKLSVPEDLGRLMILENADRNIDIALAVESLRQDQVVLIQNVEAELADTIIYDVADRLHLSDSLRLQAGFAGLNGRRQNIGKYFMSVNERGEFRFIPPHSEGHSLAGIQLASFFCYENSTDGGETILMNVDDSSNLWPSFRERTRRGRLGSRVLAPREIMRAQGQYHLNLPSDLLRPDDQVLEEQLTEIPDLTLVDVLAKPQKSYSRIVERDVYVYWDSIGSVDFDSALEYAHLLKRCGLLREPHGGLDLREMDQTPERRIWHSGVDYAQLFKCKVTRKLAPGELVIQNNLTWTHAASNWSPGSGTRKIAASFA